MRHLSSGQINNVYSNWYNILCSVVILATQDNTKHYNNWNQLLKEQSTGININQKN